MKAEIEPKRPQRPDKPLRPPYRMVEMGRCKRCGRLVKVKQMSKSIMYDGYICNDTEKCLKEKMKNE